MFRKAATSTNRQWQGQGGTAVTWQRCFTVCTQHDNHTAGTDQMATYHVQADLVKMGQEPMSIFHFTVFNYCDCVGEIKIRGKTDKNSRAYKENSEIFISVTRVNKWNMYCSFDLKEYHHPDFVFFSLYNGNETVLKLLYGTTVANIYSCIFLWKNVVYGTKQM